MFSKKILILLIFLLSMICISTVSAADNITDDDVVGLEKVNDESISVEKTLAIGKMENDTVLKDDGNSFGDLANLIKNAVPGSTIYLDKNYYADENYEKSGIVIDKDLTIDGQGYQINGQDNCRLVNVQSGTVTFINVFFIGGRINSENGGAILAPGNCKAINCTFESNHASTGGATYNVDAYNCTFKKGYSLDSQNGGGAGMYGGYAFNCIFEENIAYGNGGGIWKGTAENCIFNKNQGSGGGALSEGKAFNCTFKGNYEYTGFAVTAALGGAIYESDAENCYFEDNSATTGGASYNSNAFNCTFKDNHETFQGTVSAMYQGTALMCIFLNEDNKNDNTEILVPTIEVGNMTAKIGDTLPFRLIYDGKELNGFNTSIQVYDESSFIGNYSALSGNGWPITAGAGNFNVTLSYENYSEIQPVTVSIIVYSETIFSLSNYTGMYGTDDNFTITLKDMVGNPMHNAEITVTSDIFNDTDKNVKFYTDDNGQASFSLKNVSIGSYDISVHYNGDSFHKESDASSKIVIEKGGSQLTLKSNETVYGSGDDLVVQLKDYYGHPLSGYSVSVKLNGTKKYKTDENGQFNVSVKGLAPDTYLINMSFTGDELYNGTQNNTKFTVNKIGTQLDVNNIKVDYDVDKNVTIVLKDIYGNPLSNYSVSVELNGTKKYKTDENGQFNVSVKGLVPNTYHANITFAGNEFYAKSNATSQIVINKRATALNVNSMFTFYNVGDELVVELMDDDGNPISGVSVSVDLNGTKKYKTDENGQVRPSTNALLPGSYSVKVTFKGNDLYLSSKANSTLFVTKSFTVIDVDDLVTYYNSSEEFVIVLKDMVGNPLSGYSLSVDLNGTEIYETDGDGQVRLPIDGLLPGKYPVKVNFKLNELYLPSTATSKIVINKAPSVLNVNSVVAVYGDGDELLINLTDDEGNPISDGSVSVELDGVVKNYTTDENGQVKVSSETLLPGLYSVNVAFNGNEIYLPSTTISRIIIGKLPSVLSVNPVIAFYGDGELVINLTDDNGNPISDVIVSLNGIPIFKTDENGLINLSTGSLLPDSYPVNVTFDGNEIYLPSNASSVIIIEKLPSVLNVNNITVLYGDGEELVIGLMDDEGNPIANASVSVGLNGTKKYSTDENGQVNLSTESLLPDSYPVNVTFDGNEIYLPSNASSVIIIEKLPSVLNVNNITAFYDEGEELVIGLMDDEGNPIANASVSVDLNTIQVFTTDENGQINLSSEYLHPGSYLVNVTFEGDEIYLPASAISNITIKSTILADDVEKIFRNATQYYATFLDNEGNLLKNTTVHFDMNGVKYDRITNDKGVARLNINLDQGNYILTAENLVTGEQKSNNIVVLPPIVENRNITKYYKNGTQYVVKILNDDGSAAGAGVNVTFNINGVFYTRSTNASGHAKLNINLNPGEYIITAEYNGFKVSNNITVLPVLSAKDLSMSFKDGSKFEAKLVDGQGKPYANQIITFNIHGVFYDRTTDDEGIARLNINLMAGKYIITSMYSNGATISNNITIE